MTPLVNFETTFLDYPSAEDIAVIVYMAGCSHNCKGCQNQVLQQIHEEFEQDFLNKIIDHIITCCQRNETNKIVLSGGDPLHPCNRKLTQQICSLLGNNLQYDICVYTGYDIEAVKQMNICGFKFIKSGKFDINNTRKSEKTNEYIKFVNTTQNLFDKDFNKISNNGVYYFKNN